jgi:hypothetical protein
VHGYAARAALNVKTAEVAEEPCRTAAVAVPCFAIPVSPEKKGTVAEVEAAVEVAVIHTADDQVSADGIADRQSAPCEEAASANVTAAA